MGPKIREGVGVGTSSSTREREASESTSLIWVEFGQISEARVVEQESERNKLEAN